MFLFLIFFFKFLSKIFLLLNLLFLAVLCQYQITLGTCARRYTIFGGDTRSKQNRAIQTLASNTFWAFSRFIRSRYPGEINTIAIIYTVRNRRLHTSRVRLAYLYAACSLYTLNGKWHTHVAKR